MVQDAFYHVCIPSSGKEERGREGKATPLLWAWFGNCRCLFVLTPHWPIPGHMTQLRNFFITSLTTWKEGKMDMRYQFFPARGLSNNVFQLNVILFLFIYLFICSKFCHTLEWNSHGFTCVPHPDPPSHLPLHPLPLGFRSAPGRRACLMHPTWAGDLFHPRYYTCFDAVLLKHPTLSSPRV